MENERLIIGVDIDGVIVDFISEFIKAYHKRYPRFRKIKKEMIARHNIGSIIGLFDEEIIDLIEHTTLFHELPLIEGADITLTKLAEENDIYICTARPEHHRERTIDMLSQYNIPYKKLIFRGRNKKLEVILKELPRFDIFIEDNIAEAIHLSKLVKRVLVFRQPWNDNCLNVRKTLKYVSSWDEIYEAIGEYRKSLLPSLL
ncbi:MAG: hypothetical protein GF307_11240 [candidate division Zixibacteria bacterium]|nr:hypothetical protein [candidate division Zixibacteria bacterium]